MFRRLPLYRLLLLCGLVVVAGISATALALAVGSGPKPAAKPLAQAVHDALSAPAVEGVSADVKLTNHLLEGASLASGAGQGGEAGLRARCWPAPRDGCGSPRTAACASSCRPKRATRRSSTTATRSPLYDAATNTLYRYTPAPSDKPSGAGAGGSGDTHGAPTVAKIEEAIAHLQEHADRLRQRRLTTSPGARPTPCACRRRKAGSLLGGAELSFDAGNGVPLRAAVYSSTSSSPVIELAATAISYGPVSDSVFAFTPPANAKVEDVAPATAKTGGQTPPEHGEKPTLTTHGHGPATIAVLESKAGSNSSSSTLECAAEGQHQRHQRQRAAHRAGHAADVRARRRALRRRRLRHARRDRGTRARPVA